MKIDLKNIMVTKARGNQVPFDKEKLKKSLLRSGAGVTEADEIAEQINDILFEGIRTKEIYKKAFQLLRNYSRPVAARYKLKQAIMELGPSGFPFEQFVAELLKNKGYSVKVGEIVQGHCVDHEIDVIAEQEDQHYMIECKFHQQGKISDVKIPLYIHSRFLDVEKKWKLIKGHSEKFHQAWIVTNTRFSDDASRYGKCMQMNLISWDYPKNNGLKEWIDKSGLHPVTSLTTLSKEEKQLLLDKKIVLCKAIHHNQSVLPQIGVKQPRLQKVINECDALCTEYSSKDELIK